MKYLTLVMGAMVILLTAMVVFLFCRLRVVKKKTDTLQRDRELMEQLNEQTQKFAHHQRLQTIGTLTSGIAHEFNNLLTPIMGYSLMALEKIPTEETEIYDGILEIYKASQKAKEIVSRLSDLSRKNTDASYTRVSVDEVVRKTLDLASTVKPKTIAVRLNLNCWDQRIQANETQLMQMFLNLILNAFQAMGDNGGLLSINTTFDEKMIQISITDTGCGIPAETVPHIFEPFFSTKEVGKGTGLGLAIVAQIVETHNGEIEVETAVDWGTTFLIRLPREILLHP